MLTSKHLNAFNVEHKGASEEVAACIKACNFQHNNIPKGKSVGFGVLILTNERIAFCYKGWFTSVLESLPISKISSITRSSPFFSMPLIEVHTSGDNLIYTPGCIEPEIVEFVRKIEAMRQSSPPKVDRADASDVSTRLENLSRLHGQGLITDDEFKARRLTILDSV